MTARKPSPPSGLGRSGSALWRRVVAGYDLRVDELEVLRSACRLRDELADLEAALAKVDDPLSTGSRGQVVAHPLYEEVRRHRSALSVSLRQLGLPDDPADELRTRRARSSSARDLAMARWAR